MTVDPIGEIAEVVLGIEAELRKAELWESHPPPRAALASVQPFCYDTLEFTQWLQWVMVPRMSAILEQGLDLPTESQILPMAEECLREMPEQPAPLLVLLRRFDELIADAGRRRGS